MGCDRRGRDRATARPVRGSQHLQVGWEVPPPILSPRDERPLSARERQVVELIALGSTGPEIAEELQIAHDTVRTHVRNSMTKLRARSRAQLVANALGNHPTRYSGDPIGEPACGHVGTGGDRVRVLVVDDSAPFRRAAAALLGRRGYAVVGEAGSVVAACRAFELVEPDAVLIDVALRDGCGIELTAEFVRARPDLAVLLISADDPPDRDRQVEACGAKGFVLKSCLAAVPLEPFFGAPSS